MSDKPYNVITPEKGVPIKAWTKGVPLEDAAQKQLLNVAQLPFIYKWVAAMPDVHWGIGAVQTTLNANHLPDNLHGIREAIEKAVPVGRTDQAGRTIAGRGESATASS